MSKRKATKPNQAEHADNFDQIMDELPVKRRAKIEARANELGLPADMPQAKEQKARAGGKHPWRFRSHFRRDEAYAHHALAANQAHTRLATCRAIARKHPEIEADRLLEDLITSTPGEEGKWFATAKSLRRFDLAIKLAWRSPCDPKTLTRAARDRIEEAPAFAADAALAALHWIAAGYGYELTSLDVQEARGLALEAGEKLGQAEQVQRHIDSILAGSEPAAAWLRKVLGN